jgi:hypothetical protein
MDKADQYKARSDEVARMVRNPKLTDAEREAFERIAKEWLVLEAAARGRASRH